MDQVRLENLNSIVAESAKENVKPSKRRRGRPKGSIKKKPVTPDFAADPLGPVPEGDRISIDPEPAPSAGPEAAASAAAVMPDVQIPKEMLVLFLKAPFNMARMRTGFEGFILPDEIADQCAPLLNQVIDQYLPNAMNSPHLPAIMLVYTLGSVGFMQFQAYEEWKFVNAKKVPNEPAPPPQPFGPNGPGFMGAGVVQ